MSALDVATEYTILIAEGGADPIETASRVAVTKRRLVELAVRRGDTSRVDFRERRLTIEAPARPRRAAG
jgi:hypothetical protein